MSIELKDDLPSISPSAAKAAMRQYQMLCEAMLHESDYQTIQGKQFKKKSAWRKLARAFNVSDEIIEETKETLADGGFIWRIKVKASSQSGRSSIGVGACSTRERTFAHMDHDVYSTAHSRAKNRAISDLIGAGEVSAEEIEEDQKPQWKEFGTK